MGRTREYRTGMETELLSIDAGSSGGPAVSLFVLCGDGFEAARLFRSGTLSLHMARVEGLVPMSMATVAVGDHRWMLARDALVARVDARTFVFELPGFFYAVAMLPDAERECASMAEILSRFCAYHDLAADAAADGGGELAGELDTNPWAGAHARISRLKRHTSPAAAAANAPSDPVRQMERAVRTSAVVKLLTRSLLSGVLQPGRHLTVTDGAASANAGTSSWPSTAALPSKSVVADLLDAIETNRAVPRCGGSGGDGGLGLGWWNLNVEGVMLLLRVVQAVRGRNNLAAPAPGGKRSRDEGPAGRDTMRGGVVGGSSAARRWCGAGGRPGKIGNAPVAPVAVGALSLQRPDHHQIDA